MDKTHSSSLEQLPQLAKTVVDSLQAGDWLFLDGDLGSGKTALAKEISLLFGVKNFWNKVLNKKNVSVEWSKKLRGTI